MRKNSQIKYGVREGRNCQQAVLKAQEYVESGKCWVVEMDLSKFFDRVNHDILMDRVSRVITDKPLLKLIRRYLNAGIMEDGLASLGHKGCLKAHPSVHCFQMLCSPNWIGKSTLED